MRALCLGLVLIALIAACRPRGTDPEKRGAPRPETTAAREPADAPIRAEFDNVHLRLAPGVVLEVARLQGELRSTVRGQPPVFDDPHSFRLHVRDGEVRLSDRSLTRLLNDRVFAYDGAPLSDIEISIADGRLEQRATLHKGIPVPLTVKAEVSLSPDGRVRLHPVKVKALGIPVAALMKALHVEIADLLSVDEAPAIAIDHNDFLLTASRLIDAPRLQGRLTAIQLEGHRVVMTFGEGRPRSTAPPDGVPQNYMFYRGGVLRFGKLTMHDVDMQLIDADPSDPFDFSPPEYVRQLVAGYSKNTRSGGLRVFMPDFADMAGADLRPGRAETRPRPRGQNGRWPQRDRR